MATTRKPGLANRKSWPVQLVDDQFSWWMASSAGTPNTMNHEP